jgi:type II secretory pathway component HofQ
MDVPPRAFRTATRRFPLQHARSTHALPLVRDLLLPMAQRGPVAGQARGVSHAPVELRVVADAESNAIIARGSESDLSDVAAVLAEIDQPEASGGKSVGVIKLQYAEAADVAAVIEDLLKAPKPPAKEGPSRASPEPRPEPVTVVADERTNALLVHGDPETLQAIKALVKTLDVEVGQGGKHSR